MIGSAWWVRRCWEERSRTPVSYWLPTWAFGSEPDCSPVLFTAFSSTFRENISNCPTCDRLCPNSHNISSFTNTAEAVSGVERDLEFYVVYGGSAAGRRAGWWSTQSAFSWRIRARLLWRDKDAVCALRMAVLIWHWLLGLQANPGSQILEPRGEVGIGTSVE